MKPSPYTRPDVYLERRGVALGAANDDEREGVEELSPLPALVALAGVWLAEHWPAIALGFAAGLTALAVPAVVAVRLAS